MRERLFLVSLIFMLPLSAAAQMFGDGIASIDPFTVGLSPQYPAPFTTATLSFTSSTVDLSSGILTVSQNGKQIYQGNVQPIAISLGQAGAAVAISATLTTGGNSYHKSIVVVPEEVSLVVEPISSAPPLYPGKPLIPNDGNSRVVAIANFKDSKGKSLDPASLSYSWNVDDSDIGNSSGIGRESVMVASPLQYRNRTVSVTVKNQDGSLLASDSVALAPADPVARIYQNDPLLGILFDHAIGGTFPIASSEQSFYGTSYSLSLADGAPALTWFLNGVSAQSGNLITLRPSGDGEGSASVSFTASTGALDQATTNFSLSFGTQKSNFFGL